MVIFKINWYIRKIDSNTATQSRLGGRAERRGAGAADPPRRKPERDEGTRCPLRTVPALTAHTPALWQPAWQNLGGKTACGCSRCRRKPQGQSRRRAGLSLGLTACAAATAGGGGGGGAPPVGAGGAVRTPDRAGFAEAVNGATKTAGDTHRDTHGKRYPWGGCNALDHRALRTGSTTKKPL